MPKTTRAGTGLDGDPQFPILEASDWHNLIADCFAEMFAQGAGANAAEQLVEVLFWRFLVDRSLERCSVRHLKKKQRRRVTDPGSCPVPATTPPQRGHGALQTEGSSGKLDREGRTEERMSECTEDGAPCEREEEQGLQVLATCTNQTSEWEEHKRLNAVEQGVHS